LGRLLPSVVGGYGLAVWSFVAALVLVVPGGGQAAGSAATVVVSAPARVALGEPINLRLSVVGSPGVAGYETQLLFDAKAAHLLGVDHRGAGVAALGWDVRDLGPIELTDGVAFGSYACRSSDCVGRALSQPAGARGDVSLGTVVLRADRPGLLRLRLTATRLVDAAGSSVQADRGEQVVAGRRMRLRRPGPRAPSRVVGEASAMRRVMGGWTRQT
jgi:hypothetical protein